MVGPRRPRIVLFGSSIVQQSFKVGGWGAVLADLYDRKADIFLRGYSGWNSRLALQYLHKIFPKEAEVQPSLVIVYFGGNDAMHPHPSGLGSHVPLPEYLENMKKIYLHIKSLSEKTRIIFLTSPPVNEEMIRAHFGNLFDNQQRTNESCRAYAEALVRLGRQLNVKVVNLCTAIQQRKDWPTACFSDGIHFSPEGSNIVAKEILKVIQEADWKPSLHWMSMPAEFDEDSPYYMVRRDGKTPSNCSNDISGWKTEFTKEAIVSRL
ncbi:GDSL esterase/lipase CPRD49-like [Andrographis paniculata]|uniref:GDSL esterase/lipase CPRD49-like n=1 Tax=Andrographis paniculata TaxID=175694 RepID=UPI0021E7C36B|nr:GDSL esterase/lipase CPRD49-like [Andrographis paniculata]